nr:MAG TPA_asm: hypothetical protein [Caudoviricetes sp.]
MLFINTFLAYILFLFLSRIFVAMRTFISSL